MLEPRHPMPPARRPTVPGSGPSGFRALVSRHRTCRRMLRSITPKQVRALCGCVAPLGAPPKEPPRTPPSLRGGNGRGLTSFFSPLSEGGFRGVLLASTPCRRFAPSSQAYAIHPQSALDDHFQIRCKRLELLRHVPARGCRSGLAVAAAAASSVDRAKLLGTKSGSIYRAVSTTGLTTMKAAVDSGAGGPRETGLPSMEVRGTAACSRTSSCRL